jgi:Autographiviridae RNA polymerase
MQTQVELELEAYQFGKARMSKMIRGNEEKGRADNNPYAQAIYRRFVLPLAEIIREDLAAKRVGRRQAHVPLLAPIDPEATAYIAVRSTLVALLAGKGENHEEGAGRNVVAEVGKSVYHEYVLEHFAELEPELFYHLVNDFERRLSHNERHRMTVFKMQAKQAGVHFTEWGSGDRDQVGAYLVEQLQKLGMVETRTVRVPHAKANNIRTKILVTMMPEVVEILEQIKGFAIETTPYFLPCVEQPKDWTSVTDGGFHTKEMRRMMPWMVKTHPSQRDNFREADMSQELAAINSLQRVEWRVNRALLDAVRLVAKHFDMDEIISQAETPRPTKPSWLADGMGKDDMDESQLEEFVRWKRGVAEWHTERKIRGTKWGRFSNAMKIATKFEEYDKLWFVYFEDFRGRKYVQTTGISPQGSDLQKALLEFANGKTLSSPESIKWFKITGANRWGYDKVSLEDREKWVDEKKDLLIAFANDPVSHSEWQEADKPLQFLAWCMEYRDWCLAPSTFISRVAVGMDGSCNGLQNFSAMLRDSLGGRATNLVPSILPNDIYQMVADRTSLCLQTMEVDERGYQLRWLSHGINRTLVKRSVMTLPYGSTRYSCAEFIVQDYLRIGTVPEFEKVEYKAAANYLSHPVWDSIGDVVAKAREAMDWLQQASRIIIKSGETEIKWVTPSGFPAIQTYWEQSIHQIHTKLCGGARLKIHCDVDTPDIKRHKNGVAPNFVHSLDASHLTLTVNAAVTQGITSLAMIHDDYGTHAADAQALYHIIREQFVQMYEQHDVLEEFRALYPILPPTPEKGTLDIRQVLESKYFFA